MISVTQRVPIISWCTLSYVLFLVYSRLALQHELLNRHYKGRLILAPISIASGDRVLDSGTGSSSWLLGLISSVPPSVELFGINIESRLFLLEDERITSREGNTHFSVGTITKLPVEWSNIFLLVHQRLLVAALRFPEWIHAIREMFRVLAPDGWVQLEEVGEWKASAITDKHRSLVQTLFYAKDYSSIVPNICPLCFGPKGS
ncbi:hypothetical protein AcW1_003173 [Taiwanofungus camphoratus]|nr:hypothetical protein AcW1_003173 [Antrodia cinnamomea]